jgi:hypothetical protein
MQCQERTATTTGLSTITKSCLPAAHSGVGDRNGGEASDLSLARGDCVGKYGNE